MGSGDTPVAVSSQSTTFSDLVDSVAASDTWSKPWYVFGLPRQMIWANQTTNVGGAVTLYVEFAIRDSATPGVPDWKLLTPVGTVFVPGTPVVLQLTTGVVWLRFKLHGPVATAGETVEFANTAFV